MSRIFISYKRVDKDKVFKIKDQIESALAEKCWIDLDGIESDAVFASKIIGAINECEVFLFMYSNAHKTITAYENDWTIRELNFAQDKKKRIVFINLDGSELTDWFKLLFGTKQQVDALSDSAMKKLCTDLHTWQNIAAQPQDASEIVDSLSHKRIIPESNKIININGVEFKMIRVESGTFTMGATPEMLDRKAHDFFEDRDKPAHEVKLSTFYIGETPVTQALWKAVMGKQPFWKILTPSNPSWFKGDFRPVDDVSWDKCQKFIEKLTQKTGMEFRLPTEAEWEFAARGGNNSKHYQYSGSNNIDEVAWYRENSESKTHPVKNKKPNELGIYDMSGNVREWCQDWDGDYSEEEQTNPKGPRRGKYRMYRGGSYDCESSRCRSSFRYFHHPDCLSDSTFGFRLALSEW